METLTSLFALVSLEFLNPLLNVLKVAVGLGFVIFIHELGHFVLAKWNGVKVEKFSIGFGPALFGFRRGETEYVLAAVPLGGFVKMLGEGLEGNDQQTADPRAFPNKSVGARMAIISAGVVMNLLLGLACFVYAYGKGMTEVPAKVGAVVAGSPAYAAGLRPGDEIVAIDGRRDVTFNTLKLKVSLSGAGQLVHFEVKRPGQDAPIEVDLEPRRDATAEMPGIGIAPSLSLDLAKSPFEAPAGMSGPPRLDLQPDDRIVAAGAEGQPLVPVREIEDLHAILARDREQPLRAEVERREAHGGAPGAGAQPKRATITLPANHFVDFGFRLAMEPISALRKGSPASEAGFRVGDRIVKVDGREDIDPMRLPDLCYKHAGRPLTFEVERRESGASGKLVTLTATPDASPPWTDLFLAEGKPLDVPGLGLAYPVRTKIVAVIPGSPAERAGLKVGDVINSLRLLVPQPGSKKGDGEPKSYTFDETNPAWVSAFALLQLLPRHAVELTVNHAKAPVSITPEPEEDWPHPLRGLQFRLLTRLMQAQSASAAIRMGFDDTIDKVLSIYAMFRSLWQQRVSPKNLGGPILIAQVAYGEAASGLTDLIYFLGFLSINLAVLNFLPIPPLDGGHMVFLIAEKVRGRPLPESALVAGTYLGLLFVLGLMAFVIFQDVFRLVTG